ncbi:MAG TPA: inorganic phosphate transporter, partial [Candidatus Limnocylindria bacterium]|nr:inorganic phosphate transporter [Candidatus Limnocylindria bacterium]
VAGNIVVAWLLTLPAAAVIGGAAYGVTRVFGTGSLGPAVVTTIGLALVAIAFARRIREGAPVPAR